MREQKNEDTSVTHEGNVYREKSHIANQDEQTQEPDGQV